MRFNYWTCSKFADWVRGSGKPESATFRDWRTWRIQAKAKNPIRYWIAEEGLDHLQKIVYYIPDRLNDVRYYINNRWVTRTHCLTAHPRDIKPGVWSDVGSRFLPCLFNELVNFVEVEQAWHHVRWNDEEKMKFQPTWLRTGWLRWRNWRSPEAGLAHLKWAANLKFDAHMGISTSDPEFGTPTQQAIAAKEIIVLYKWWTEKRPNRPDPYEVSGWNKFYVNDRSKDDEDFFSDEQTEHEKLDSRKALNIANQIEKSYAKEDEEMMIRLIRIRESLWT